MKRARFASALLAVALGGANVLTTQPAHAAPPSFSGCELLDDGRPMRANDQYGAWMYSIIKYRCNTGKEFSFLGTLYQNPDGQDGRAINSIGNGGVSTAPYVTGSYGHCDSTARSTFNIGYWLEINGVEKYYQTPVYTRYCHFN